MVVVEALALLLSDELFIPAGILPAPAGVVVSGLFSLFLHGTKSKELMGLKARAFFFQPTNIHFKKLTKMFSFWQIVFCFISKVAGRTEFFFILQRLSACIIKKIERSLFESFSKKEQNSFLFFLKRTTTPPWCYRRLLLICYWIDLIPNFCVTHHYHPIFITQTVKNLNCSFVKMLCNNVFHEIAESNREPNLTMHENYRTCFYHAMMLFKLWCLMVIIVYSNILMQHQSNNWTVCCFKMFQWQCFSLKKREQKNRFVQIRTNAMCGLKYKNLNKSNTLGW